MNLILDEKGKAENMFRSKIDRVYSCFIENKLMTVCKDTEIRENDDN